MVASEPIPSTMLVRVKPIYPRYREGGHVFRIGDQRDLTLEFYRSDWRIETNSAAKAPKSGGTKRTPIRMGRSAASLLPHS